MHLRYTKAMNEVDTYLERVTPTQKDSLQHIRELIHKIIPDVEEVIGYGMPTFKYKGKNVIHIAAFKDHMSLFPTSEPIEALKTRLTAYKTSKGTIQFSESNPIPDDLLRELITTSFERVKARLN